MTFASCNLPNPGIEPASLALQEDSLPCKPLGKPNVFWRPFCVVWILYTVASPEFGSYQLIFPYTNSVLFFLSSSGYPLFSCRSFLAESNSCHKVRFKKYSPLPESFQEFYLKADHVKEKISNSFPMFSYMIFIYFFSSRIYLRV